MLVATLAAASLPASAESAGAKPGQEPRRQTWEEYMTVDLAAPVQELPPLPDAEARSKAFAERDRPEEIERLAKRLYALWDRSERRASANPHTSHLDQEKARVVARFEAKDYPGALAAYRTYLIHKIQVLYYAHPSSFTGGDFTSRLDSAVPRKRYEAMAELLMKHAYQVPVTKQTVRIGEPGLMHWEWRADGAQNPWDNLVKPQIEYFCGSDFDKLWWRFVDTKERAYLDTWLAYLDDYTLNDHFQEDLSALNLDLGKQGLSDSMCFFLALTQISGALPAGDEVIPAATVARMMLRQLEIVVPQSSFYNRQQSNNHSPGTSAAFMLLSEFVSDFKLAKTLVHESRRQFETYGSMDARPDGSGPGRLPEYVMFEYRENLPTLDFIRHGGFEWFTPMLNREYRDRMVARERYVVHMISPQGEYIDSQKNDDRRRIGFESKVALFNSAYPEVFDDPDIARITERIFRNMAGPDWQGKVGLAPESPLARMGMGGGAAEEPSYASLSFPYDRIHIMSSGFDPKRDQYGVLLGSSAKGRGDSMMKENKATNHFVISAFDRDIFRNGVDYAYNYLNSPVTVDGQDQFNGAGEGPTSRRGMANYGLDPIDPYRLHHSAAFDVAESVYDHAYVSTGEHDPEYYDYHTKLDNLRKATWGISHRRVVQFVKGHGLWIVTDLMRSDAPHEYAQQWWLGKRNKEAPDGWLEDEIHADGEARAIRSQVTGDVNFSMYHLGPAELDAATGSAPAALAYDPVREKPKPVDAFTGARADRHEGWLFIQLRGSWKSQGGRSQLITVIYPRKTIGDELVSLTPAKRADGQVNGFVAKLRDGATVSYAASFEKPEPLAAGGLAAEAEALLVLTEPGGAVSGTVLGCSATEGRLPRAGTDFEFSLAGEPSTSPIQRPIQPVEISPGHEGFVDRIEVAMATPTPGTEIRYTVDGNDPTLASPRYAGPLVFTDTVMVKARAFRIGLKAMPPLTPTGTEMTEPATAVFTRQLVHLPNTWAKATRPGLAYDYYEAKWPYFIYGVDPNLAPLRSGEVPAAFDVSASGGERKQAFAFVYRGYLDVPADGVYTIYAPDEFTRYRPLAGYDLKLALGYRVQSDGEGRQRTPNQGVPLEDWYPATRRHGFGTWSIALAKGLQPISIYYADMRPGAVLQYLGCEYPGWNVPGLTKIVWDGEAPVLQISGPGLERQPIPKGWYRHE
jgi:hypothetical protein